MTKKSREEVTETVPAAGEKRVVFPADPEKLKCPRCKSIQTRQRGAIHKDTQYRICKMPICRKRFAVKGEYV